MLTVGFYEDALAVQNASNLSGVVHSFSRVLEILRGEGLSTDEIAAHPITRCWADKIASLTGIQHGPLAGEAFDMVHRHIEEAIRNG